MTTRQVMIAEAPFVPPPPPPGSDYDVKVQGYSPIVFLPLSDGGGSVAVDYGSLGQDGAYGGTISDQAATGMGDGETCIQLSSNQTGNVNFYSTALQGAFDGDLGTMMLWYRKDNPSACGGGNPNAFILDGSGHDLSIGYSYPAGDYVFGRTGATSLDSIGCGSTAWQCWVLRWNQASDGFRLYLNGSFTEGDATISAWAGTLSDAIIGARYGGNSMYGHYAKLALWDTDLGDPAITDLAGV